VDKVTVPSLLEKKKARSPLVALTCYDAASARLVDEAGVDIALVGDSMANVRLGYPSTLPISLDEMVHHTRAAARGVDRALLVADMPFQSYEAAPWIAAKSAGRLIKEGNATAVKLEGGRRMAPAIRAILDSNIPVMGHLGLTPQSVNVMGGYKVQGKTPKAAKDLMDDAVLLEKLGVFSIVLEGVPADLAKKVSRKLKIPTIGIGAGAGCDGQILVLDDLLGLTEGRSPKFVVRYAELRREALSAVRRYAADVRGRKFPDDAHSYH
jgi:3-methyl-2-oxobutanoate hydroxymethyltransferase